MRMYAAIPDARSATPIATWSMRVRMVALTSSPVAPLNVDTTGIDVSYHWSERGLKLPFQGATGLEVRATILTRNDHVAIGVADLASGIAAYMRIGFEVDS